MHNIRSSPYLTGSGVKVPPQADIRPVSGAVCMWIESQESRLQVSVVAPECCWLPEELPGGGARGVALHHLPELVQHL